MTSGYRQKLLKRNQMIYNEFVRGKTIADLADEYFLSMDSIKKIVYGKKVGLIAYGKGGVSVIYERFRSVFSVRFLFLISQNRKGF